MMQKQPDNLSKITLKNTDPITLAASLINEALDEIDLGAQPMEGSAFFASMKKRYGK